ncbi:helix-turn-helix domain-containing protein [Pseudonocardia sp. CA-107938]|uniref:helix-turn-helix domain-containing protein n=1 Tax=Pseudonocardia sp. CA-107938 TaxID=3240021 RepID=UPI003D89CBD0
MIADHGPDVEPSRRRRTLAAALVAMREATGLNQTEFGARSGMNQPKVSRLETGRQVPTLDEAMAWADAAGASPDRREDLAEQVRIALREPVEMAEYLERGAPHRQRQIGMQERSVGLMRDAQISIVPGLLQTAEYTRRQVGLSGLLRPELGGDRTASLVAWAERKEALYDPDRRFEFVITEAALRWRPGPDDAPHVLRAQLRHLASLSTLANVRIGVIPWRTPMHSCPEHGFIIYGEPGKDPEVWVHTGTKTTSTEHRDPDDVAIYQRLWELLVADALFEDDARAELDRIASTL